MSSHKVGVVIVSYNSADELKACVSAARDSILKDGCTLEAVVVDNNSGDDSLKVAKKAGAAVIANEKNEGFAKAVNAGVRHMLEKGMSHILILNPDAIVRPDCIRIMMDDFGSDERIGACGPHMLDAKGKPSNEGYYLKAPSWISVLLFSTFLRSRFIKKPFWVNHFYEQAGLKKSQAVEQIPGACLLTSRQVLEKVGLLDEDFAIWFEDVEWSYRARKHGYQMWYCKDALVQHEGGVSFEKWQNLDKAVTFYVSMKTFFKKHKPFSYPMVILVLCSNSLVLYAKSGDRSNLVFLKKFLKQKKGNLPG